MAYDPLSSISKIHRLTGNENIVLTQGETPTGNGRYPLEQLKKELGNKSLLGSVTPLTNDIEQGVYIASEVGVYPNFGNIEVTQQDFDNGLVLLTKNNDGTFSKDLVPMPGVVLENQINVEGGVTGFNPIGEVKEGDKRAVSGDEVNGFLDIERIKSVNIADLNYAIMGKYVNSNLNGGDNNIPINISTTTDFTTIYIPINTTESHLLIQGWNTSRSEIYYGTGLIPELSTINLGMARNRLITCGSLANLGFSPKVNGTVKVPIPQDTGWVAINIRGRLENDDVFSTFMVEYGNESTPFSQYSSFINGIIKINGSDIIASRVLHTEGVSNIIYCEGDSTTEGADLVNQSAERWTTLLQTKLGENYSIINKGTSGARAEEINARLSAINAPITLSTGNIIGNGNNKLLFPELNPYRAGSTGVEYSYSADIYNYSGILASGYVRRVTSQNIVFYNSLSNEINVGNEELTLVSSVNKQNYPLIIVGYGANNIALINNETQTIEYLKQQYRYLFSIYPRVMFWGQTDRGVSEISIIQELEEFLISEFGNMFCPVRRYLASDQALTDAKKIDAQFVPTSEDEIAITNGVIPPSFKASAGSAHLNAMGHILQANFFYNHISQYYFI